MAEEKLKEDQEGNTVEKQFEQKNHSQNAEIVVEDLIKSFMIGKEPYEALRGLSVEIKKGDFTIIYGPSGSGKSTFLNCLIGLEPPTKGKVWVGGERIDHMNEDDRAGLRARRFGIVNQQPLWVKALTALENVALPLVIKGTDEKVAIRKAKEAIREVGLTKWQNHKPTELSGGQQQKISLARALVNNPSILVLDEPTGNLDTHSSDEVLAMLQELKGNHKRTIIMVTHNLVYLPYADRTIEIRDGLIEKVKDREKSKTFAAFAAEGGKHEI